jgi:hypothetical protein
MRVRSPPCRPGASATNSTRGASVPLSELSTARLSHIRAQRTQAAASSASARKAAAWSVKEVIRQ